MTGRRLPPLHAVRAFEAAARHRSVTRAAGELGVTPGAVSRHIRTLEDRMAAPLFVRRATGLEPTAAGEALAGVVGEALDRIAEAVSGVHLRRGRRLRIGVYGYFASRFLLPRWPALLAAHAELQADIHTTLNPLELMPGRYDAVIAVSDGTDRAGLRTHRLMPIATVPVCSPRVAREAADCPDWFLLHARPRPDDWRRWLDHAGVRARPARGDSSFESIGLALEAAAAGLGHAIGIEALLTPELRSGTLVLAHPCVRPTRRHFVLEYEARHADDAALRRFVDWLRGEAAAAFPPGG